MNVCGNARLKSLRRRVNTSTRRPCPNPTADGDFIEEHTIHVKPSAPIVHLLRPICASSKVLEVEVETSDTVGLESVQVAFTSLDSATAKESVLPFAVGTHKGRSDCKDKTQSKCQTAAPFKAHQKQTARYQFALESAWLDRLVSGSELLETSAADRAKTQAKFRAFSPSASDAQPESAWITLTACNRAGQCTSRPMLTDVEYRLMLTTQCQALAAE